MKTFNVHLVIGNTQIILKGAQEWSITESAKQPQLTAKAPKGGKTVFQREVDSANEPLISAVTIHEVTSNQEDVPPEPAEIETQPHE